MRDAFIRQLESEAAKDPSIILVVGDLGFGVVDRFMETMPDQFLNAGVSEQAMIGVAAGLAARGRKVFVYSIANFPTMRCLEQIRMDVCYHERDVTIVSVGAGTSYGSLGYSHHAVEDLAVMRSLPGMTVMSPADPVEATALTKIALTVGGPKYLRLGKAGEPVIHVTDPQIQVGLPVHLRDGEDVALVATGGVLQTAMAAADRLEGHGVSVRVLSMPTLKPIDGQAFCAAISGVRAVVTVEEHSSIGGLRSAVLETLQSEGVFATPVGSVAWPDRVVHATGSTGYLRGLVGITDEGVSAEVLRVLGAGGL